MSRLGGNDLLSQIEQDNPKLGIYLRQYLIPSITRTAQNAAVSPTGSVAAPQPPAMVHVATFGEMVHVSIEDHQPLNRGINYFTEIGVNDPHIQQPIVYHHGTSRTPPPFSLPSLISGGGSPVSHQYYIQSYSQYPGGPPSERTRFNGGAAITLSGTTVGTPLPSRGSGTASGNGTQPGQGFGKSPVRLK
jgi:hypothetical protein